MTGYATLLKEWRSHRRVSQLDLALQANVSARHISFLETGRSRPSPGMIVQLSEVLEVPVDARNQMLRAAGFAPRYAATPLDDAKMAPITQAISRMLERHAPYPGLVLDRLWRVIMLNGPASVLFAPFGLREGSNLLDLATDPIMAQIVENWADVAYHTMQRLRAESAAAGGIAELEEAIAKLAPFAHLSEKPEDAPTIPTIYRFGDMRLSLFGTIAQFSTVNDETLADLKVELFYPSEAESAQWFEAAELGGGAGTGA